MLTISLQGVSMAVQPPTEDPLKEHHRSCVDHAYCSVCQSFSLEI